MSEQSKNWLSTVCAGKSRRDSELLMRAVKTLEDNIYTEGNYLWSPYRCICPGRTNFLGIWNWDSAFHAVGVSEWDVEFARENVIGFMQFQREDGMLPDCVFEDGRVLAISSKPPMFAWAVEILHRKEKNMDFLEKIYPRLVKEEAFWAQKRCYEGLFYYDSSNVDSVDYDLYIRYESGWDNAVRWDDGILQYWAIDLNCFMVMYYQSLKYLAEELGRLEEAELWNQKEKVLADLINSKMWDDKNKCYVDVNRFTGEKSTVLTPASFMPLFAQVASDEQAEAMNRLAMDKNKFYSGMPTVAYDDPQYHDSYYWRGPTWLNVAYFAAKGLKKYGYQVADEIKETILNWCDNDKDGIFENYNSKSGKGLFCDHFSWSSVFIIEFILHM